jgi:hypothetical protein
MKCAICGSDHDDAKCFLIKAYEYFPSGKVKRVEFFTLSELKLTDPLLARLPDTAYGSKQ